MITSKSIISIIIVNYKSWQDLQNCLDAILLIESKDIAIEVVVVDNSLDLTTLNEFKVKYEQFNFFLNSGNNGFSNGCNLGASKANGDYFLFLNPDTIITKAPVLEMFGAVSENSNLGAVSCLQKNNDGSFEKSIRFFPKLRTLFGFFRAFFKYSLQKSVVKDNHFLYPDWISGAVVFISKEWFFRVKGWNEDYWMYFEDVDLSKQIRDKNGKVALLTNTHIIHNHGGSSRINIQTASITKLEVIISKHVYIFNHFKGGKHFVLQTLIAVTTIISKIIFGLLGLFLFFVPKLKLQFILMRKVFKYYFLQ